MSKKALFINKHITDILIKVYTDIFLDINQSQLDVFLCGGASNREKISDRDNIRKLLYKDKNIRILYPEDLFIEILNRDKESDLLTLEGVLADNCDVICIVCESPGSLVELGAFTNNEKTINKVMAVLDKHRKRDKSFIMQGPVKMLKRNDKNSIVFYSPSDIDELCKKLESIFHSKILFNIKYRAPKRDINSIIGMHYYELLIVYFFNTLEYNRFINYIKFTFLYKQYNIKEFNTIINPSIKYLYKQKYIQKFSENEHNYIKLTFHGYKYIAGLMNNLAIEYRTKLYDSIRFDIIKEEYYR